MCVCALLLLFLLTPEAAFGSQGHTVLGMMVWKGLSPRVHGFAPQVAGAVFGGSRTLGRGWL